MIFSLQDVSIVYNEKSLFAPVSFDLSKGEKIVINGASGAGKSSLFNILLGFEQRYRGKIDYKGNRLSPAVVQKVREEVGWLPQEIPALPGITVKEFIDIPFGYQANRMYRPTKDQIGYWFDELQLKPSLLDNPIDTVSGGEKQRIGIITLLLLQRQILLLDEPIAALDATMAKKVADILLCNENLSVIASSHNPIWNNHCNKTVTL